MRSRETCIILRETKSRSVYRYYPNIRSSCFISKNCIFQSTSIIFILLIRSNIELNPGPPKIISVNCRGLSSRVKLLSSIGKLRKECEKTSHGKDSKVVVKAIVLELYDVFILVLRVQDSNWYNLFNSTSRREGWVGPIFHISKMIFVCDL